jgi:phage gpG-like protein
MTENGINVTLDNTEELLKSVKELAKQQVLVGIPSSGSRSDGPSNATLGYIHEFGSPARNIPARPFLFPAVNKLKDKATEMLKEAASLYMDHKEGQAKAVLESIGIMAMNAVKNNIVSGGDPTFAPLAPATLSARQARGHAGTKPLIETGQLLNSITYLVRKKG